jgi:DNA polymerase-4
MTKAGASRQVLCRDCLAALRNDAAAARCRECGSPRIVAHDELGGLTIAHIDCDAFYASIEKRDNPELRDKPLIVGGGRRGVVSTCCYIARTFGVRSAMPMFQAMKLCPSAVVVRPNMAKYIAVGREIRRRMEALTPLVEPLSIDEAFLDLTGCERVHGASAATTLARFAKQIHDEIGVTVSVGLSYCKFLAKFASELDKPNGFSVIGAKEAMAVLAPQPINRIFGVGKVSEQRLAKSGLRLIGDIQALDQAAMLRIEGPEGARLWRLAHGVDTRRVSSERETKSISSETTFETDVADLERLTRTLLGLCEKVAGRLKREGLACRTVTLKLRTAEFRTRTRAQGAPPTQLSTRIFQIARKLLEREATGEAFRLIGVATTDFAPAAAADAGDLVDQGVGREKAREHAIDELRDRFGAEAIVRGIAFGAPKRG